MVVEQNVSASAPNLPVFVTAAGNPNTGKTNTAILLIELRKLDLDDLLVLSNVRSWDATDIVDTS